MRAKYKKLILKQLDDTLKIFYPIRTMVAPPKGWIHAIRIGLGMSARQLGERMNVNRQRIDRIEQDEKQGRVTVNTLRNVAEAMDCEFVYGFVPRETLELTVRDQARRVAVKRMNRSNQMMRLEAQELGDAEKVQVLKELIDEIIETMPRNLWDE